MHKPTNHLTNLHEVAVKGRKEKKMATVRDQIQADWENREFVEVLTGSVKKLAEFLNNFGKSF